MEGIVMTSLVVVGSMCVFCKAPNLHLAHPSLNYVKQVLAVACISTVFSLDALTQSSGLSGINVVIKRLSTEQGLSNRSVYAIMQDQRGFIWIGTENGLNRYDGQNFMAYRNDPADTTSLSNDVVWALCEDRDGFIWVGTYLGVNKFDPATRTFTRYVHNPQNPSSISNNDIRAIFEDRAGMLWVATGRGLNRFDRNTGKWTRFFPNPSDSSRPADNFVSAILEDSHNAFWIGTGDWNQSGGGLMRFDRKNGVFVRYRHNPSDPQSLCNDWVLSLHEDRSGDLWVGTNAGLDRFDRASESFVHYALPAKGPNTESSRAIKSICEDKTGALWIATWGWGLNRFERQSNTFTRYAFDVRDPGSISSSTLTTLFLDRAGLLWVGTYKGGVNTVSSKQFVHRRSLPNLPRMNSEVFALHDDRRGNLWVGLGSDGLWKFNYMTRTARRVMPGIPRASCILEDSAGGIWISTLHQVIRYDPERGTTILAATIPMYDGIWDPVGCFLLDRSGTIWAGSVFGRLYRFGNPMNRYSLPTVTSILEDQSGCIWVGTFDGLFRFQEATHSFARFVHESGNPSSLSNSSIRSLYEDHSGNVWVGTQNGLNRYDAKGGTFKPYARADGLDGQQIAPIGEDERGNLWLGTEMGISMFNPATCRFRNYDESDGLESVDYMPLSHTRTGSGEILFGTSCGIMVFHPDSLEASPFVPPIAITGVSRLNRPVFFSSLPELVRECAFEHDENVFSIEFAALSYDMSAFNRHAYKLEGFDKDWVYCGNRRVAMYTNLDPGVYAFRVKGSNHDDVWNEAGTSLRVIVNPAFWQTWWFRIGVALFCVGVLFSLYRYRLSKLLELQCLRLRIADDLHDDIGSELSGIALESDLIARQLQGETPQHLRLVNVGRSIRAAADNLRDVVWIVNPELDTVPDLAARMRAVAAKMLAGHRLTFESSASLLQYSLEMEFKRHVLMMFKEMLNNVLRHAGATHVQIEVHLKAQHLRVNVKDDGIGFTLSSDFTGRGLAGLRARAAAIGGTLTIESTPGLGTRVCLEADITRSSD